jgi:hypothetical protein
MILTVSLPICIPFISSSCLIALARNYSTLLTKSGDSGHPCLIFYFRGYGFSFSLLSMMLAVGLSHIAFTVLRYIPSIHSFLRAFIMKSLSLSVSFSILGLELRAFTLSHSTSSIFCDRIFQNRVLQNICLGWLQSVLSKSFSASIEMIKSSH